MSTRNPKKSNEEQGDEEYDGNSSSETYGTPIRPRQRFTAEETRILEDLFKTTIRPSSEAKQNLARQFETSTQRIQIWFQNRRAKEKKHAPTELPDSDDVKQMGESSSHGDRSYQRKRKREEEDEDDVDHVTVPRVPLHPSPHIYRIPPQGDHSFTDMVPYPFGFPRQLNRDSGNHLYYFPQPSTVNPHDMERPPRFGGHQFVIPEGEYDADGGDYVSDTSHSLNMPATTSTQGDNHEHGGDDPYIPVKGEF